MAGGNGIYKRPRPCFVYLIAETDKGGAAVPPCKVGVAFAPHKRLASLQCGNPRRLVIVKTWKLPSEAVARCVEDVALSNLPRKSLSSDGWFGEWTFGDPDRSARLIGVIAMHLPPEWRSDGDPIDVLPEKVCFQ